MPKPPPPPRPPRPAPAIDPLFELPHPEPAELDEATKRRLADAISKAIAAELGAVRVSSVPPPSDPPRSSMRVAASVGAKAGGKVGKVGTMIIGGLALAGQILVWFGKPEYASPIGQALKIIAAAIQAAAGGGPPTVE